MAGKNYMNIAREGTFDTAPASGWSGIEVEDLGGHDPRVVTLQPNSMVYGQQGPTTSGRRTLVRGGTGTIKPYLQSTGLQVLFDAVFGTPTVTELAAGEAWQYVYETSDAASAVSIAAQVGREFQGGTVDKDTFTGGQVGEMRITQGKTPQSSGTTDEGLAKLEFDVDYAGFVPAEAQRLPTYPDPEIFHSGGDFTLSVGASLAALDAECLNSWKLTVPAGLDFEAAACASTVTRDQAGRGELPMPKIEAAWSYKNRTYYDAWLNGTILAMRALWHPAGIFLDAGETIRPKVQIDIAAFGFTGETPKESQTETTKQDLPGEVLWNGDDPMITVTVVSSEAPFTEES